MRIKKLGYSLGIAIAVIFSISTNSFALDSLDQIKGIDRYETAKLIAEKQSYNKVILVNSERTLADGLSASGLAGAENAPILLVKQSSIPTATLSRLGGVKKAYIIGTTDSISDSIENQIKNLGIETERLGGANRIETSEKVAEKIISLKKINKIMVANGFRGEADAISASAIAARDGDPIVLTDGNTFNMSVDKSQINRYVLGSSDSVSDNVANQLSAIRIGGANRFETNKNMIYYFYKDFSQVHLAQAYNLVDSLTVSPIAKNKPVVLVSQGSNKEVIRNAKKMTVVGGVDKNAVREAVNAATNNRPNDHGFYFDVTNSQFAGWIRSQMYSQLNDYRKANGRSNLNNISRLEGLSTDWSKLMANRNTMSHVIDGKNSYSTFMNYLDWTKVPDGYALVQSEYIYKGKPEDKYVYRSTDANEIAKRIIEVWKTQGSNGGGDILHKGYASMGFGLSVKPDNTIYATQEFHGIYKP
ncbi:MAG: cell wall-binding repeat-containing protein [Clostridioides sp.]|nr:cell wall-binding repeat-containing protein [Clostridioides sp.]